MARAKHGLPGIYNATPITLTDQEGAAPALDVNGRLIISGAASGATDSGNPVKIGGVYNSSAPTFTTGQRGDIQIDANGNLKTTEATKLAGEDLVNDVLKVEGRFSYSPVAVADVQVKSGAGFLHTITISCNDAAPTAGSLIVYDSLTETGTQIFNHTFTTTPFVPLTVFIDSSFSTGLYLGFTTTADVNVTASYR